MSGYGANEFGAGQQPGRLWLRNELAAEASATTQASGAPGDLDYGTGPQPGRLWLRNNLATDSVTTDGGESIAASSRQQSQVSNYAPKPPRRGPVGLSAIKEKRVEEAEDDDDDDDDQGFFGRGNADRKKKRKNWDTPPPTTATVAKRLENLTLRIFAWSTMFVHGIAVALWIAFFIRLVDWRKEKPGLRPTPNARLEASIFFVLIEFTLIISGSIALIRRIRPLAMLTIILLITCTSTMHVFWADVRLRLVSLGIVFMTVVCASTMTWFSEDIQHEENVELTRQIREIEKDPRKNRELIYDIEASQSRNVVFFALLTTFMAEAAFIVGIAMIVLSLLVRFPIFPGDQIMITHLRVAGIILTVGSLIGAFGAYTKRRTFLLMAMIISITAALSASNMGATSAMLRNWLSEVQKFCKNGQITGTQPKDCAKQNTLAIAAAAVNYMAWITSVVLSWGCWMLEEFIQDWEEAESKNVDRNLSDEFDLIPGLITIIDPIAFYFKLFVSFGGINSLCAVGLIVVSRIPGDAAENRWRIYAILLGPCLLVTFAFQLYAYVKKKGRLPLTLAFFMTTWITGFCLHMAYIVFTMFRSGAHTGYVIQPVSVAGKEILLLNPREYFDRTSRRKMHIEWVMGLTIVCTVFSVCNMFFIIITSEAIQDRDEERPSLPKRRRTHNVWEDGLVGRLRSTVSQFSQFFGRNTQRPGAEQPDDIGNGRSFFSNWGKSFTKSFAAGRRRPNEFNAPDHQVTQTMPSYLAAALQDDNAQGIVLGPSEKSFLARTLGLKGRSPAPLRQPQQQQSYGVVPPLRPPPQRQGSDSGDSFKSYTKTPRAMAKRGDLVEEPKKQRVGFITRMLSKKQSGPMTVDAPEEDFDNPMGHPAPRGVPIIDEEEEEEYDTFTPQYQTGGQAFKLGGGAARPAPNKAAMLGGMSFQQGVEIGAGGPVSPYQLPTPSAPVPSGFAPTPAAAAAADDEVPPVVKNTSIAKVMGWFSHVPEDTADPIPTPIGSEDEDDNDYDAEDIGDLPDTGSMVSGVSHGGQSLVTSQIAGGNLASLGSLRPGAAPTAPPVPGSVKQYTIQKINLDD